MVGRVSCDRQACPATEAEEADCLSNGASHLRCLSRPEAGVVALKLAPSVSPRAQEGRAPGCNVKRKGGEIAPVCCLGSDALNYSEARTLGCEPRPLVAPSRRSASKVPGTGPERIGNAFFELPPPSSLFLSSPSTSPVQPGVSWSPLLSMAVASFQNPVM